MHRIHRLALALVLLALLVVPRPSYAVDVRVEVAPLVAIPLNSLLDGVPVEFQFQTAAMPQAIDAILLTDLSQKTGGGVSLSLLLNDWELRYEFAALSYDRLSAPRIRFPGLADVAGDVGEVAGQVYIPTSLISETGTTPSVDVSDALDSVLLHNIVVGYRFTPFDWVVHPYFPFGVGFAVAQLRNGADTLLGFNVQLGAGVQWDPLESLRLGLAVRFSFSAYKNPSTSLASIEQSGLQNALTNASSFEALMETLRLVTLNLHVSYKF